MLMMLIFTILGLSILSASIGGAKRTEVRETQVEDDLIDIKDLNEAVAYIKSMIGKYDESMSIAKFNDLIIEMDITGPYKDHIEDISQESPYNFSTEDLSKYFTRILRVTSENYSQTVYVTGMPSFLKYALGSRGELTLNGSVYLKEGNLYAKDGLNISTEARYRINDNPMQVETTPPSVSDSNENLLFLEKDNIRFCNSKCYSGDDITGIFLDIPVDSFAERIPKVFDPTAPKFTKDSSEFVDVNIIETFKEKLEDAGFSKVEIDTLIDQEELESITPSKKIKTINTISDDEINNSSGASAYFIQGEHIYFDTDNLNIGKSWLVIDGNAYFDNVGLDPETSKRTIEGNILVTGNAYMEGELSLNSTMYVLGETIINNAKINANDSDNILILMTEGKLELARFNKFEDPGSHSINAYLYTDQNAEVYAVGSSITITGGLFANGNLEINAFRGISKGLDSSGTDLVLEPDDKNNVESSRFTIAQEEKLFIDQKEGLPKVKKLEILTDLMEKK